MKCPGYVHAPDEVRLQGVLAAVAFVLPLFGAAQVKFEGILRCWWGLMLVYHSRRWPEGGLCPFGRF
jgi:hypothetical protein